MNRPFPSGLSIPVVLNDGATQVFTGAELNRLYELAQADFRTQNQLDAKGFSRLPRKTVQPKNKIEYVSIRSALQA